MGNAAAKEFNEKELGVGGSLHEPDGKNSFAASMVTKEVMTLLGKTNLTGGKGGYSYSKEIDDKKAVFMTQAEGAMGRKGSVHDGDKKLLAYVRIDHQMKSSVQSFYKTEPSYEGQTALEGEKVEGDKNLYLFAKIETTRSGQDIHSAYSVVTGKDDSGSETFLPLYKAKRIIASSFKALVETAGDDGTAVGKISSVFGLPREQLQVASGVDLAAVILTGQATAPNGDMVSQLPGATFGL